jgi:transcriptional pleiotropic regulator of transition state genes
MMQATGIVRKVDELGRIVLPKELRNTLGINVKDAIEIYTEGDKIILRKYEPNCVFCGGTKGTKLYMGKIVCEYCRRELGNIRGDDSDGAQEAGA